MVTDDVILEQVEFTYDSAGNVVQTVTRRRYHNAPDSQTGPLADPSTTPKARVTYVASYPDPLGRVTPAYNRAGNMTTVPKPSDPTQSYTATYDAWNRLIRMEAGADKVAEYEYDGAKRRTVQKTYTAGVLSETRHLYYTEPSKWQVIEERVGSSSDAERQFVWGLRYIDDLVLRDRDTDANGSLDERLYALQDANWNVTAVTNASGTVQERYAYSAYGVPIFLDATFGSRASSSYAWETLYAGYRWDQAIRQFQVRHRVYNPIGGSWLQRDPIGLPSGINLYEYVASSPLMKLDPTGQWILPASCLGALTGCAGVPLIGLIACYSSTTNADDFSDCWNTFLDGLPPWQKILWAAVCVGLAICLVIYLRRLCRPRPRRRVCVCLMVGPHPVDGRMCYHSHTDFWKCLCFYNCFPGTFVAPGIRLFI